MLLEPDVSDGSVTACCATSMVHKGKEDRRREAIGFEIPVTRGAFDQGEGSTDDIKCHITINNTGRKVL